MAQWSNPMNNRTYYRETFILAKIALLSVILAFVTTGLFCFLVSFGIDSGLLAVLSFPLCVIALLLGFVSILVILLFHHRFKGLVCSIAAVVLSLPIVYIGIQIFRVSNVRAENEKKYTNLYNMKLLHKAMKEYAQDHNGVLPDANTWCDDLMNQAPTLTAENFRFPDPDFLELQGECHIAFNSNLSGRLLAEIPGGVVLLFEADGAWNLNGTWSLLSLPYGEAKFSSIKCVDGTNLDYWPDQKGVRKFDSAGKRMWHEPPQWGP